MMLQFEKLSTLILPLTVLSFILLILLVKIYITFRRKFPIKVNCWFCNSWTKVPYDNWNSYYCSICHQYNGFSKNGDYNIIIPEKYNELLNGINNLKNVASTTKNGLCNKCNYNQRLKVFQLANFVPLNEKNYDVEVEHFRQQVEKAFELCKKCNEFIKVKLAKQNSLLYGNCLKNINMNAIHLINKSRYCKNVCIRFFIVIIALLFIIYRAMLSTLPTSFLPYILILRDYDYKIASFLKRNIFFISSDFYSTPEYGSLICLSIIGFILQCFIILDQYSKHIKINQIFAWSILLLTSWIPVKMSKNSHVYILFMQMFALGYIIYATILQNNTKKLILKDKQMNVRKIDKNFNKPIELSNFSNSNENIKSFNNIFTKNMYNNNVNKIDWMSNLKPPRSNLINSVSDINNTATRFENLLSTQYIPNNDINTSFGNLHLHGTETKHSKKILSPSKFNQNSWLAANFCKHTLKNNHSCTSSESSGFESQSADNNPFYIGQSPSRPISIFHSDYDKNSIISEPSYCTSNNIGQNLFYRNENIFYPVLRQNNLLFIRDVENSNYTSSKPLYDNYRHRSMRKSTFNNCPGLETSIFNLE